jgi:integrase
MTDQEHIPRLYQLMFGDHARFAVRNVNGHFLKWAQAFDAWLEERKHPYISNFCNSIQAWRYLIELHNKTPWSITKDDILGYKDWLLHERGFAPNTVSFFLVAVSSFYEWCGKRCIDPQCGTDFNPTKGVPRSGTDKNSERTKILSPEESQALLEVFKSDQSLLSRRDYAFFLCCLRLGVKNKLLRHLQWGQIELRDGGAWVDWRNGKAPMLLPAEVWQAVAGYLEAAGRLGPARQGEMPPEAYIFAPTVAKYGRDLKGAAEYWDERRPLSCCVMKRCLITYGKLVGIEGDKLLLPALRHAALDRYLETSPSLPEIEAFLGSPSPRKAREFVAFHRRICQRMSGKEAKIEMPGSTRSRQPCDFTSQELFKHGLYTHYLPHDEVAAILSEGVEGIEGEKAGMQSMIEGAWKWYERLAGDDRVQVEVGIAFMAATDRLFNFTRLEEQAAEQGQSEHDGWGVDLIHYVCEYCGEEKPDLETIYSWIDEDQPPDPLKVKVQALSIACDRLVLRNLKRLAEETDDPLEYVRYLQKYGAGFTRLCKMVRGSRHEEGKIARWVEGLLAKLMADERESMGLPRGDDTYYPPWIGTGKSKRRKK